MKSKTIILSKLDDKNSNSRGIITFYPEDDLLKCKLRLYSTPSLTRDCKIGIFHNEQVYSANFIFRNGVYESSFVGDFDLDGDFYTAIVDTAHENHVILAGGTYAGYYFDDGNIFNTPQEKPHHNYQNENYNQTPNLHLNDNQKYSTKNLAEQNTMNKKETTALNNDDCLTADCNKCLNCKYKEYFYNHTDNDYTFSPTDNETKNEYKTPQQDLPAPQEQKEEITPTQAHSIIQAIIPQFDYIFENYPLDNDLNSMLENSKFVKINEDNDQYSIGVIYENNTPKYICYAKHSNYNLSAPKELGEHYQWLPLDPEDPLSEGYYIVYQDAKDLKILEL